jgi:hypothetical protein
MTEGTPNAAGTELERSTADSILVIPRLIGGALADIRTIAEGMSLLPSLLDALNSIDARVQTLDDEVRLMRARVDAMGGDVTELKAGIGRVEPHLEDVTRLVHPLRRISERARGRGRAPDG